jgi:hypothetical protein
MFPAGNSLTLPVSLVFAKGLGGEGGFLAFAKSLLDGNIL